MSLHMVSPWMITGGMLVGVLMVAGLAQWLVHATVFRLIRRTLRRQSDEVLRQWDATNVFRYASMMVPLAIVYAGVQPVLLPYPRTMTGIMDVLMMAWVVVLLQLIRSLMAWMIGRLHQSQLVNTALVRTMHQLIMIVLALVGVIAIISILFNKSPLLILSSFGALTAVILLVFKDSILGLVASIQVSLLGMVKEGDWIEMPAYHADGTILDINISSIRVQNWDKTITTIPTYALVRDPVKNWRGMEMAHCRRIKRAIWIDPQSIQACDATWFDQCFQDPRIATHKAAVCDACSSAGTNLQAFRYYLKTYLMHHSAIVPSETLLVRQLAPNQYGIPLEVYCFTNTTNWGDYEAIQSDLFDHLFLMLPVFGLRLFQLRHDGD